MSLLMEALKKAEQAKHKAAAGPVAVPSAPVTAPVLALELTPAEPISARPGAPYKIETPPSIPAPALTAAAFTLMTGRLAETSPPADVLAASLRIDAVPPSPPPLPPAPALQPNMAPPPARVELSIDTSTQPARPAPVARPLPQRRRIPMVWIAGGVALLFASVGGGYWYYNSMAQYLTQQATLGVPQAALSPEPADTSAAPVAAPMMSTPQPVAPAAAKNAPRPATKVNTVSKPLSAEALPVAAVVPAPVVAVPSGVSLTADVVASVPVPPSVPITISRDAEQNELFVALQTAYRAYRSGDDSSAQKLYAGVLGRDQHNRDALLGLAAIAVRQKDFVRAQEIYSELLTLDPKDSIAQAGFVSVTGSFDPLQQEARIKALLEQEPGAPHLLFTYASFLMQQQRWLEAARTLQSAVQAQRDNADYAFNLAVSFDHLGQAEAAVKYYREALALASRQPTNFRVEDVRRRLKIMSPGGEGATP